MLLVVLVAGLGYFVTSGTDGEGDAAPGDAALGGSPSEVDELKACFSATEELNAASLEYERRVELTKSDSRTITVTLRNKPLGEPGFVNQEIRVACTVSARLVVSSSDLEVSPTEWVEQQYVPPDPTAWKWVVTGKEGGESEAVLEVKPAIRLELSNGSAQVEDLRTETFPLTFETNTTAIQKVTSLWGLVIGAASGVATLIGAWFLIRRLAGGKDGSDDDGVADPPVQEKAVTEQKEAGVGTATKKEAGKRRPSSTG